MTDTYRESEALLALPDAEILAKLGVDLLGPQAVPQRPAELAERGRRWLEAQRDYLEKEICSNESLRQFVQGTNDNAAIAVELATLLAGLLLPVNPVALAVLFAKRGLKSFCSIRWSAHV